MIDTSTSKAVTATLRSIQTPEEGWRMLFGMVIFQALHDAITPSPIRSKENLKELRAEALGFLRDGGLDLACGLAGWDSEYVREQCEELIGEGARPEG